MPRNIVDEFCVLNHNHFRT